MANELGPASLDWCAGRVPVSRAFGDVYYSAADGLAETEHVFVMGNRLHDRFVGAQTFRIGELGFGTGLSFLVAWTLWRRLAPGGRLVFTSFEIAPLPAADMARALAPFPEVAEGAARLLDAWPTDGWGDGLVQLPGATLEVRLGDARATLPKWQGEADAWFLDGFAPDRNPELWEPCLMHAVARHTKPRGTVATYSAAGHVRRALAAAGFMVERQSGYGRKRHMTVGRLDG